VWDARMTIEPSAVRRLAETATKATLKELDDELDALRAAIEDPREFNTTSVRFHLKLVELSGNHTLTAVIGMLSVIIERELAKTLAEIGADIEEVRRADRRGLRSCEKVVELIRARDADKAELAWRDHMKSARRYIAKTQKQDRVIDLLY